ncbi:ABC transporter permease [Desmospora activa]|uniref:Transport permease protein n=1 Tax=Desmospora activa DSM 45169 TaxID=1121389 RepID=A0A2T4ZA35_9BACL|nr:ABC transporter permease [Desmospora activa]PTM58733.1 ABC-2 type transport system permease protein [Desmospora activa DSM 45169]
MNKAYNKEDRFHDVIYSNQRPNPPNALYSSFTFASRSLLKMKHFPEQLFDVVVFPAVVLVMFTYLFGGAIAGSANDYLQFLLSGILVMTVTQITIYSGLDVNKDINKGIFDRFRTLPIWLPSSLVGLLLVDTIRYTMACVVMVSLGLLLGFQPDGGFSGVAGAILIILVFSFCLSWVWTTFGLVARSDKSLMMASMMFLYPLTFVSNAFIDPGTLPSFLRWFVALNPISALVTAVRGLMHGTATWEQIAVVMLISLAMMLIFVPITMHLYRKKSR